MADDRYWRRNEPAEPGDDTAGLRRRFEALLPSVLKRTMVSGVEAAQATEDVIRGMVGELKLPREVVTYLVDVADNTRREVVRVAAREFREFLESANLTEELVRILTSVSFEMKTEIRFVPNDQRLRPNVRSQVRVRSDGSDEAGEAGNAAAIVRDSGLVDVLDDMLRAGATDLAERLLRRTRPEGRAADAPPVEARAPDPAAVVDGAGAASADGAASPSPRATRARKRTTARKPR